MKVVGALLAAGASRRMGESKQLLKLDDDVCLVRHAAQAMAATTLEQRCVVVGTEASEIARALAGLDLDLIPSQDPSEGIAASIRAAVSWARRQEAHALLLCVCDQPRLSSAHLERLLVTFKEEHNPTASHYEGAAGVPAVFPAACFAQLAELAGDSGAAKILRKAQNVVSVAWPDGAQDLDTPDDVAAWRGRERLE